LFEGSFEIFDDFLGEHVGIGRVIGLFEAFVSEPEDVEARLSRLVALRNCKPANAIIAVRIWLSILDLNASTALSELPEAQLSYYCFSQWLRLCLST
jgi:hypothetical protein